MNSNRFSGRASLRRMVAIAMFSAMAYVAMLLLHIKVSFLTLDVKDAVITLCGLYFGPVSALIISIIVPLLEMITVSTTGAYGLIMNISSSIAFSVTASLVYKYKKSLWGAIVGLATAAAVLVSVMLLLNLWVTPYYMGVPVETVRGLIPTLLFPFNLLKAVANVGIVLLLYKSMSKALRRAGFLHRVGAKSEQGGVAASPVPAAKKRLVTVVITIVALLLITLSMVLIFTVFEGTLSFGIQK